MKYIFISLIIGLELFCCVVILLFILKGKNIFHNNTSFSVIPRAGISSTASANLKYFYEPKQGQIDVINGAKITYLINSDTLNERFDYTVDKADEVYRIITLGDSITFGLKVNTRDNWTEKLEDKLNGKCDSGKRFEVINLGVQGYDSAYAVERYKRRGEKYSPDLVIWYQFDLLRWVEEQQKVLSKYNDIKSKIDSLDSEVAQKILYDLLQQAARSTYYKYGEKNLLEYQRDEIASLRNYYKGKLLLVAYPEMKSSFKKYLDQSFGRQKDTFLFLNTNNYVAKRQLMDDVHPNPLGHETIAEDLFGYLNENKLVPCK